MMKRSINENWLFRMLPEESLDNKSLESLEESSGYVELSLPHSWYRDEDQYRGLTVYRKKLELPNREKFYILEILGADQRAEVYGNGQLLGSHKGAYGSFYIELPKSMTETGSIDLVIYVDNSVNQKISPIFGDFTVFGGLYRGINLIESEESHFDYSYYGTDGVIVNTHYQDNVGTVEAEVRAKIAGSSAKAQFRLLDPNGGLVLEGEQELSETGDAKYFGRIAFEVADFTLWNGRRNPALYTFWVSLFVDGQSVDQNEKRIGFRSIFMDSNEGFRLNGEKIKIQGVSKHQDRAEKFSAISPVDIREDFSIISEIGANAVRLSHYQHCQETYELCDEEGYLTWAEIPMLKMTEDAELLQNAEEQLRELVLQNLHHPSIFCWGIQNEIGMFRDTEYMHRECTRLKDVAKELDPYRLVTAANLYNVKFDSKLNEITDMVGYNLYFGWYYGEMQDYSEYLDKLHETEPGMPFGISEYGVDASPYLHAENPMVKDYSEEYQALFHETVYPIFEGKDYLWGSFIWNLFDFSSARRNEGGTRFINQKGLVTYDRGTKKDAFYYYKAKWLEEPFLHICSKRFEKRAKASIDIKIYTNLPEAELGFGESRQRGVNNGNGTILFRDIPLTEGENRFTVSGVGEHSGINDEVCFLRVEKEEESYRLPDSGAGESVKNWFLEEDSLIREGYFSLEDSANDLLENPDAFQVLKEFAPMIAKEIEGDGGIPLGFAMIRILQYKKEVLQQVDVKGFNERLNQIKK